MSEQIIEVDGDTLESLRKDWPRDLAGVRAIQFHYTMDGEYQYAALRRLDGTITPRHSQRFTRDLEFEAWAAYEVLHDALQDNIVFPF